MAEKAEEVRDHVWMGGQGGPSLSPGGLLTTRWVLRAPTFSTNSQKALRTLGGFYLESLILGTYSREIIRQKCRDVCTDRFSLMLFFLVTKKSPSRKSLKVWNSLIMEAYTD